MRDLKTITANIAVPAVHLVTVRAPSKSHLGGFASLPAGTAWPEYQGRKLEFLARISLPELHQALRIDWLPKEGALLFFYDIEEQPWGFDPKDRGSCAVLHVPDLASPIDGATIATADEELPHLNVAFREIRSLPSSERSAIDELGLSDEEQESYWELPEEAFDGLPRHQVSGFPAPVQGDHMELECQLASNGLYCGDSTGYSDPRAKQLESGASEWRLLLQLDSDDDLDVMWGDCGTLYFWIREQEAAVGNFKNTWLVLQCG